MNIAPRIITVGGRYDGALRTAILGWKESRWPGPADDFADMIAAGIRASGPTLPGRQILVVPVPSTVTSRVVRGGDLVWDLAQRAASRTVPGASPRRLLLRRRGRDQVGLSAQSRIANASASYVARRRSPADDPVLLIDDVVTTGATLTACAMALSRRGWLVAGAVVLCGTKVRPWTPPCP
ncbi:MAG: ComF family protein [Actinobacteria bacterium]|nr:ComF family protein [Actinomycetota bacterium]